MSLTVDEILCILGQDFDPWSDPSLTAKPHQRAKSVHLKEGEGREDRESGEGEKQERKGRKERDEGRGTMNSSVKHYMAKVFLPVEKTNFQGGTCPVT